LTALAARLADRIRAAGPIGVDAFMAAALGDPAAGYYTTRDPLGAGGDFTTAPEISQIFGEVIGFWCAHLWQAMGGPDPLLLVELGPGRGTLMADLLRALAVLPGCRASVQVHLVETSPALRAAQQATLERRHPGLDIAWHDSIETVPSGPMLLVANEFFDALPIRQWVKRGAGWTERRVGLDAEGGFAFVEHQTTETIEAPDGADGAIFETSPASLAIAEIIGRRLAAAPGAALIVDYGHGRTSCGETLQAVRSHRPAPVLASPGEADLTAHVDFDSLAAACRRAGARTHGPATQRGFLLANGAGLRAEKLMQGKDAATRGAVAAGFQRLIDPAQMGLLFKVLAVTAPGLATPPGFTPEESP
jgi:NADH dehydrogenase [ubiquinone] 1 alpha subcomplex assembly factor 7